MPWTPIRTADDLVRRLARGTLEQGQLDFKREYDVTRPKVRYELAKDVAAFASAYGGTILVGIIWNNREIVGLNSVSDAPRLVGLLSTALQQYAVPIPPTPVEDAIVLSVAEASQILSAETSAPASDTTILAINVDPDPRGPIAVRAERSGQPENDTYRFPIRVGDQTEFLNPMQLPMWMNSHERRLALHLRALLAQGPCVVRIHRRIGYNQQTNRARICELLSLDENHRHVVVGQRDNQTLTPPFTISGPQATVTANVPLTYISAVWHDPQGVPEIAVNGSLFADFDPLRPFNTPPFVPYLGGA